MSSSAFLARVVAGCLVLAALPAAAVVVPHEQALRQMPDQLIVRFRDDAGVVERDAQMLRVGAEPAGRFGRGRNTLLRLPRGSNMKAAIARFEASGLVEYAHPNYIASKHGLCAALVVPHACPNENTFNSQYHLHNPYLDQNGFDSDADMDMPEAWSLITSSSVLLAIIDDGFDLSHPDLDANLRQGLTCNQLNASCGGNAGQQTGNELHGTYVAGSAAAVGNNGSGVSGVMWNADVLPLRMPNYTTVEQVMSVDEAIAQGARVINMSFGGPVFAQAMLDAIDRARQAGILVVASAGNDDTNTDKAVAAYPSNYPLDNLLAVAASDAGDGIAEFSQWGSFSVDLAAAGDGVWTTQVGGTITTVDGTSFSAPITAGAAALIGQYLINNGNTTWDYKELKARLLVGADNASDSGDLPLRGRVAAGRVNVRKSLNPLVGAVLTVESLAFDDSTLIDPGNDADGQPDPGETLDVIVTLRNAWDADSNIQATLSTTDPNATVLSGGFGNYASIGQYGTASASFRVQLSDFTSNEQILFRLELSPQTGALRWRWFYLEVGALRNGVEVVQPIGTNTWDEFHAWHANVPAGSTNIRFESQTNNIDIDLLARRLTPPLYAADLVAHFTFDLCDGSDPCTFGIDSGGPGNETIEPSTTGLWHLVVANAAHTAHSYRIKASWDAGGAGTVRFNGATSSTTEGVGTTAILVVRSGGVGAVSVNYNTASGSATAGSDFTTTNGTLTWANGDTAPKAIVVPITADSTSENAESFTVTLSNPFGGVDIGRYGVNTVTIGNATTGGGGGGGGGGTADALLLAGLGLLLAARRRRAR